MKLPSFKEVIATSNFIVIKPEKDFMKLPPLKVPDLQKHFYCVTCNRSFKRKYDMVRHSRIHLKEKPFRCNFCHKGFTRKDSLAKHIETAKRKSNKMKKKNS
jgi:uncharacterized Zn-finger protein